MFSDLEKQQYVPGDEVEIIKGPLAGLRGILKSMDQHGVLISVDFLKRSAPVRVAIEQLKLLRTRDTVIAEQLRIAVSPITAEAILYLATHPEEMYPLDPTKFENLVAALLEDAGYSVKITPTRDGGRDILAVFKIPYGQVLTIVDCKRFAPHRRIVPEVIQRLLWVSDNHDRASQAMVVTTSSFTSGARLLAQEYRWRLKLKEYTDIHEWLSQFGSWHPHDDGTVWLPRPSRSDESPPVLASHHCL